MSTDAEVRAIAEKVFGKPAPYWPPGSLVGQVDDHAPLGLDRPALPGRGPGEPVITVHEAGDTAE